VAAEAGAPPRPDLADFDYALPPDRIAQHPTPERDGARLLVLDRADGAIAHERVRDLPRLLAAGDLLVVNATRVLRARLRGAKLGSGGAVEALLLGPGPRAGEFRALVRGRVREGAKLHFGGAAGGIDAEVLATDGGEGVLRFVGDASPYRFGETPLPPYIRRAQADPGDVERYQTVYAREAGSVAAPTAGLHFTRALLDALAARGVERAEVVLHVGPGTFRPLREADLAAGRLHAEPFELPPACADAVARARERGGRVVAVGTTTARVLETCAAAGGLVAAGSGTTDLFLRPGSPFRVVDALLTNFHLPRSSLLLLVAAFAGRARVLRAYAEAVAAGYRFHSYGDAMLCA
jgi:S-adenosylmethionine:tRNA ribosyltransferase-isomerase